MPCVQGNDRAVLSWAKALHKSGDHEGTKVRNVLAARNTVTVAVAIAQRKLYRMAADKGNEDAREILEKR